MDPILFLFLNCLNSYPLAIVIASIVIARAIKSVGR